MKTKLLFAALALYSGVALSATVTITNSSFEFSPDNISINVGDTVIFQIASIHNAVEVSESTWSANGNTPLTGGFSVGFGGGQVTGLAAGVHFYVCQPHASLGMKGKITVNAASGIDTPEASKDKITIYPNPSNGKFTVQFQNSLTTTGSGTGVDENISLDVYNLPGEKIYTLPYFKQQASNEVDLSFLPTGIYFLKIYDRKKMYTQKLVIQ